MSESIPTTAEWADGRSWPPRALILAWVGWMAITALRDPDYQSLFRGVNFGIHEFGHIAFGGFGLFVGVLGGSLMQLLVPALAGVAIFVTQKDWFALSVCGAWFASSLAELSRYIGDARALEMDLVSLGEDDGSSEFTGHDWNYLLYKTGHLQDDLKIAAFCRFVAGVILFVSVVHALRLFWLMAKAPKVTSG